MPTLITLERPLKRDEIVNLTDNGSKPLEAVVRFGLYEMMENIEIINELVDDSIFFGYGYLSDITYQVFGHELPTDEDKSGSILILVTGDVNDYLDMYPVEETKDG